MSASGTVILHADVDAFFASVAQRDDPALRGRPVIVGGGVVMAASYEARRFGVRSGMGGAQARRLCPQAIIANPSWSDYVAASKAVFAVFERTADAVEPMGIEEAFLDLTGRARTKGEARAIGERLRAQVREETSLPITVGIARTKLVAKMASRAAKPDGLLVVAPSEERAFLHPLRVEQLWGVGPKTARRLHAAELRTVGQLARLTEAELVEILGTGSGGASTPRAEPRPHAGAAGPAAALVRHAALAGGRARPPAHRAGARRDRRRPRRARHRPDGEGRLHRPHGRPAPALRRLHPRDALAHAARRDRRAPSRSSPRHARCSPRPRR